MKIAICTLIGKTIWFLSLSRNEDYKTNTLIEYTNSGTTELKNFRPKPDGIAGIHRGAISFVYQAKKFKSDENDE